MTGNLYFNRSARNVINKDLQNKSSDMTIHYKETTDKLNPDILISNSVTITDYNYIHVNGKYYYIEDVEMAQQYYILHCHVDVLMTYKSDIYNTSCIVSKNEKVYNLYLNDNRLKLLNKSKILTFPFSRGFKIQGSKHFEFVLTVNGGGSASSNTNIGT